MVKYDYDHQAYTHHFKEFYKVPNISFAMVRIFGSECFVHVYHYIIPYSPAKE